MRVLADQSGQPFSNMFLPKRSDYQKLGNAHSAIAAAAPRRLCETLRQVIQQHRANDTHDHPQPLSIMATSNSESQESPSLNPSRLPPTSAPACANGCAVRETASR